MVSIKVPDIYENCELDSNADSTILVTAVVIIEEYLMKNMKFTDTASLTVTSRLR